MNNEQTNIERGRCAGHLSITANRTDSATIYLAANRILTERSVFSRNLISLQEQIQSDRLTNVSIALGLVNALPTDNLYEQNFKTVSRIYLQTLAQDITVLTTSQFNEVSAISHQCIVDGGSAVLDARMLYQLKEIKNFSDDTLCIPVGQRTPVVSQRKGEQPLQIRLVPNPANEIVRIEGLTLGTNEVAVVELADLNGRIIETTSLTGDQPAFNLNQVPQGVYSCRIIKNGMLFQTLKLIVIH